MVQTTTLIKIKVDFMTTCSWLLGQVYEWYTTSNGQVTCHISQEAFVEPLLEKSKFLECKPTRTPYQLGCMIDQVINDGIDYLHLIKLVHY